MKIEILKIDGQKSGKKIDLPESIFGIEPNDHAVYLSVKQFLAQQRQGTHKSKERNEIVGSTRKIKKQKGTGTARAGSIKNPLFRGGGRVFGPEPRDYSFKLNKKVKALAKKSALTYKAQDGNIKVTEDFSFDDHKTKNMVNALNNLELSGKTLFLVSENDPNVVLASRNLPGVSVKIAQNVNVYELMFADQLILTTGGLDSLNKVFA